MVGVSVSRLQHLIAFGDEVERALPAAETNMGNLFKRKKDSLNWQMRYRVWDVSRGGWGEYKYESTQTSNRREAEAMLLERVA